MHKEITQGFQRYLEQLGYSKSSIFMLPRCVLDFLEYTNTTDITQIKQQEIQRFYEYLQQRQHKRKAEALSETFIHHNIYSLKVFFSWLEKTHQIDFNPISNLKFKRPQVNVRQPLSQQEIKELFDNVVDTKEIALLHLFYSCGLRRTEAENLNIRDIHFGTNLLYIRDGKGAKRRVVPINEKVKRELERYYLDVRQKIPINQVQEDEKEAFMLNTVGTRMSGESYNRALKSILKRTSIQKIITLHHLRHSIATHLLENGLSVELVRDFLGHSHLETTQIYTKVFKHQLKGL